MKQNLFKTWLMLLCLFIGIGSAWAESTVTTYTFNSKSWGATCNGQAANWTGSKDGNQYSASSSPIGVQILTAGNGTTVTSPRSYTNVSKVVVNYSSSGKGVGSIKVSVGSTNIDTKSISKSQSKVDLTYTPSTNLSGNVVITCNCTTNSYALVSVSITEETGGGSTPTALSVPTNLSSSNITTTGATLSWDEVANASSYTVKIGAQEHTGVTTTSYSATGLTAGTQYTWTVKAVGDGTSYFTSDYAANANFTTEAEQGGGEPSSEYTHDVLTNADFTATSTTYKDFSNVSKNTAVYAGNSAKNNGIQLRSNNSNSGIVSTTSGGKIKTVTVTWNSNTASGRTIDVYGSNTAYTSAADLYNSTKQGTKLGSIVKGTSTSVTVTGDYAYVGIRSNSSSLNIDDIDFAWEEEGGDPTPTDKTLVSIAVTGTPSTFWKGDAFNHEGITVTATWNDETTTDVTSSCSYTGYDMSTAGDQAVTVTYLEKTATYGINVKTIANTQETAYTTAEAKALIDAGKDLATEVYVKGTVSKVESYNESHGSITYWLDEDGFEIYCGLAQNGEKFSGLDDIKEGATVVVYGIIKKYSSTYEMDKNNVLVSYSEPAAKIITALEVSGTPTKTTYNVGDAFETAGLVVTATYSDETQEVISTGFEWEIDYGTGNEALVAGATSVDVMVYTEGQEVMSEVFTVNGLIVTVPVTLTSIAVSGTPTKTSYYVGDAFETAGLVVTGTYSDSHQEPITEGIEWTVDPETLSLGTTSVEVMASVGSIVSDVYTVEGLTVTKPDFETVTYTFSSFTSGTSVELTDLDGFTITLKGNGGTNPAWSSNQARVYAKGSLTVKANNAIIKSIEYDYVVNKNSKGVSPTIDGVEGTTDAGTWDVESKTWTGADEEVTFSTSGSAGNIGFTKLIIKYIESTKIETSLEWSATEAEVTISANDNVFPTLTTTPADLAGVTYESSNTDVATIAEDGTITLVKAGKTTITANYAGNAEYASATPASYTLTVVKAPFVPTPAAEGYEAVDFKNVVYSSLTGNDTEQIDEYEGTSFSMAFAKPDGQNTYYTKYFANGSAVRTYTGNTITITSAEPITKVDIAWAESYVDDAVSITGLGTTTVVVTFSKNCRFTAITVDYRETISLVATAKEGEVDYYYATFSSAKAVEFIDAEVYTVTVTEDATISLHEVEGKQVPAGEGVLIKTTKNKAAYKNIAEATTLGENCLVATTENGEFNDGTDTDNRYYKLAYGDNNNKTKLGFYWGAAEGKGNFNVKAGGAVLVVPVVTAVNVRGFSFGGEIVQPTGIENLPALDAQPATIYNLQGQRISKALKGVNIVNGRKVIR